MVCSPLKWMSWYFCAYQACSVSQQWVLESSEIDLTYTDDFGVLMIEYKTIF